MMNNNRMGELFCFIVLQFSLICHNSTGRMTLLLYSKAKFVHSLLAVDFVLRYLVNALTRTFMHKFVQNGMMKL